MDTKKEELIASTITDAVNGSFDPEVFCKAMGCEHRTLQQNFMRYIVVPFIQYAAQDTYRTDDRNQATHDLSVKLAKTIEEAGMGLPYI